jgi:hypothetical protein
MSTPLCGYGRICDHVLSASLLLRHTPPDLAVPALNHAERLAGRLAETLLPLLVYHWPLTASQWQAIPSPCPGLACVLPTVLARSEAEAAALVAHLPAVSKACLRTAALGLHRIQHLLQLQLPREVLGHILSLCVHEPLDS